MESLLILSAFYTLKYEAEKGKSSSSGSHNKQATDPRFNLGSLAPDPAFLSITLYQCHSIELPAGLEMFYNIVCLKCG